ncbi:MAG: HDIG domain-containing protein [Candidatus Syntrophosphaera sp.]
MNSKYFLIAIIVTLCATGLYQITNAGRLSYPEYKVSVGQVADFELIAPFDFPILKSEEQIQQEYQQKLAEYGRPHSLNPDVEFQAYSNMDRLFALLYEAADTKNYEAVAITAKQQGFILDSSYLEMLREPADITQAYETIKSNLNYAYDVGIYANVNSDSILVVTDSGLRKNNISRYFQSQQILRLIVSLIDPYIGRILENNANTLIRPNLIVDTRQYEKLKNTVIDSLEPSSGLVKQGEVLISKNQRLTEEDINKLNSLVEEYKTRGNGKSALTQLLGLFGFLLYIFIIVFTFNFHLAQIQSQDAKKDSALIMLNVGFLLLIVMGILTNNVFELEPMHVPFAMIAISAAILIGFDFAILYAACGILLLGPFINWEVYSMGLLLLATLLTLSLIQKFKSRHEFLRIWFFHFFSINLINLSYTLYLRGNDLGPNMTLFAKNAGYAVVSTTITVLGCLAIVKYFEKRWNRATKEILLDLLDFNHPLLKKLATNAAGTYHHSLIVGNLSERAAEAIGTNALLARVGSYYHDIGKVSNPEIYTENNEESSEIHDQYTPEESANIIRNHVKEGVILATKYHLPQPVIDIINQHHGTSYIRYFLDAAQKNGEVKDSSVFRYPGPLPKSKEATLVMIADIVESTTKSKNEASDEEIQKIIEETVQRLIRDGQFDDSPLSLKEMKITKQVMQPILESIYRKRLDYPEETTT